MEKIVKIEGKEIGLKVTAGTVCTYRDIFGRDLLNDMSLFESELLKNRALSTDTAAIAEKAIWTMAKEYGEEHGEDIPQLKEWLDGFSPLFTYNACVHAINMWVEGMKTLNSTKKNKKERRANGLLRFLFCGRCS